MPRPAAIPLDWVQSPPSNIWVPPHWVTLDGGPKTHVIEKKYRNTSYYHTLLSASGLLPPTNPSIIIPWEAPTGPPSFTPPVSIWGWLRGGLVVVGVVVGVETIVQAGNNIWNAEQIQRALLREMSLMNVLLCKCYELSDMLHETWSFVFNGNYNAECIRMINKLRDDFAAMVDHFKGFVNSAWYMLQQLYNADPAQVVDPTYGYINCIAVLQRERDRLRAALSALTARAMSQLTKPPCSIHWLSGPITTPHPLP
jgi:hypothetical protein